MKGYRWWLGGGVAVLALLTAGVWLVLSSGWFAEQVRQQIVDTVQRATGGRVELKRFDFDWSTMTARVDQFVLHGTEQPPKAPLLSTQSVTLAVHIRSLLGRDVELRTLTVEKPEFHLYLNPDGTTNFPGPHTNTRTNPIEALLRLKIQRLELKNGIFELDTRKYDFNLLANGLEAGLDYVANGPYYQTHFVARELRLQNYDGIGIRSDLRLDASGIFLDRVHVERSATVVDFTGRLTDFFDPHIQGKFTAVASAPQWLGPIMRAGTIRAEGEGFWNWNDYQVKAKIQGSDLGAAFDVIRVGGARLDGQMELTPRALTLNQATVRLLGGVFSGKAVLTNWKDYQVDGRVAGIRLSQALAASRTPSVNWDAQIGGPIKLNGSLAVKEPALRALHAELNAEALPGQLPATGGVTVDWDVPRKAVQVSDGFLQMPSTRASFDGALGKRLAFTLASGDLGEVDQVLTLYLGQPQITPYLKLNQGEAKLEGTIIGPLNQPIVQGHVTFSNVVVEDAPLDSVAGDFLVAARRFDFRNLRVTHRGAVVDGEGSVDLENWRVQPASAIATRFQVRNADIANMLRLFRSPEHATGRIDASLTASGSIDQPRGQLNVTLHDLEFAGERFKLVRGGLATANAGTLTASGTLELDQAKVNVRTTYRHVVGDWRDGQVEIHVDGTQFSLAESENIQRLQKGLTGAGSVNLDGLIAITSGELLLKKLDGFVEVANIASGDTRFGRLRISAKTEGTTLSASLDSDWLQRKLQGSATVQLARGYPSTGKLEVPPMPFRVISQTLGTFTENGGDLPLRGFVEGNATWSAPLADFTQGRARVTLTRLVVRPRDTQLLETQLEPTELSLRNASPIIFDMDANGVRVTSAQLTALETNLTMAGAYSFKSKSPWDVSLQGVMNLAVLTSFRPDLTASGTAKINASMKGSAAAPAVSGKMEIAKGSFYLRDVPNGVENAEGTIFFERDRANIVGLTGTTGGGKFQITGFVGYGTTETTYRLQMTANNVRVRYPEGVSTTLDALLNLTGTSNRSLLAGTITIQRSGFNAKQDFGTFLAGSAAPVPVAGSQNEFLRNMQLDVSVKASPEATFQTSYTQDLQTEADLKIRGSPTKPVVLGSVKVNQGEIQFFGTRYTISRGEILFYNTAVIQPVVNLNLETRIRGVTVYININGPLSRLDINYRSEPPLQSQEILALLTVGRAPAATSTSVPAGQMTSSPAVGGSGLSATNSSTLLGGALSASLSSRVEKFFGASRIKIDPTSTGVENIPQARLSVEQSLSRDITLTYSTNLARSSQQIIRMEWDLSKEWSVVAVRDENGSFGVDFLFRRRFK